jgi:wobble nucleotide-excising tRNase
MLTKIKKIRNLGVFGDYAGNAELPDFGRYNVIYGENGAGKTTLSRLLSCLETGSHPDHPSLEFSIVSQSGQLSHQVPYARKVRVFNSDYVEANIGRLDGPLRHILILGEENKALAEELKSDLAAKESRELQINGLDAAIAKLNTDRGKLFSLIAKTIGEATSGSTLRSYRKPDAEAAYRAMTANEPLSDDMLGKHRETVRQDQMDAIGPIGKDGDTSWMIDEALRASVDATTRAKGLSIRTAQSAVIERLAKNHAIAAWVDHGIELHEKHHSDHCEFCLQPLSPERMKALADHFSLEDQDLKDEIEREMTQLDTLMGVCDRVSSPDPLAFYSELRPDYESAVADLGEALAVLKTDLKAVRDELAKKLTLRSTSYEIDVACDAKSVAASLAAIRVVIDRHNEKSAQFDEEKDRARKALESHYLLEIKSSELEFAKKIKTSEERIAVLRGGGAELGDIRSLDELQASIEEKRAKVSSEHTGGKELTDHLKQFLGRTDLRFDSTPDGYRVLRRGKPAKRLSEGERTAVAFLYFLVHLKDQEFDISEGVVVIDDPISSLDSSAIYQAFSFLKNQTKGAKQLFILTHNFEFLRLLINWISNIRPKSDKRSYTMVLCSETEEGRSARLVKLDQLLIDHPTEYHYLFKILHTFKSDGTIASCYHIPNMARKVLETFLEFHAPSDKNLLQKLDDTQFDSYKKTAIYKFTNDLSHHTGKGFDPALVSEAQKNTQYLLEMIAEVAPLHYNGLTTLSAS